MKRNLYISDKRSSVIWGDCEDWLEFVLPNSVKCIYIDPPFFSQKNYEIIWGNGHEKRCFTDRFKGGKEHYLDWMRTKLLQAKKKLSPDGSIFLHCDQKANYRLRMLLDEVFGEKNFVNEIIWHYRRWTGKSKKFQTLHDTILFYCKENKYRKFNPLWTDYTEGSKKRKLGGKMRRFKKGFEPVLVSNRSLDSKGVRMGDVWTQIPFLSSSSKERIGYRTQKPKALISRFILATTKERDMVMDFMGGGWKHCTGLH